MSFFRHGVDMHILHFSFMYKTQYAVIKLYKKTFLCINAVRVNRIPFLNAGQHSVNLATP